MDDDCADRGCNKRIVAELFLIYWVNPNLLYRFELWNNLFNFYGKQRDCMAIIDMIYF